MDGAHFFAQPAADTFRAVCMLHRIYLHLTCLGTGAASRTFVLIHPVPEHRYWIEHRINGSQGANIFAERPVYQNRKYNRHCQSYILPHIQPAQCTAHRFVQQHQRQASLQRPRRTDEFTEIRRALSQHIHQKHRQKYDKYRQYYIF